MCIFGGGSAPPDNSAAIARQEEAARQARINEGRTAIDTSFAGFNDDYYDQYRDAYSANYTPQLAQQYRRAYEKAVLGLAGSGNLNSSQGARVLSDLTGEYRRQGNVLNDNAVGAVNSLRGRVETARSDLYNQNRAAADPSTSAAIAQTQAETLQAPQPFTPLGDIFSSLINNAGTVLALESRGNPGFRTGWFDVGARPAYSSGGSGRVVG